MKSRKIRTVHLSTLTVLAIGLTVAAAVAVSITAFITVYNNALMQNAGISSEQAVRQTATIVSNYVQNLEANHDRISRDISLCADFETVNELVTSASKFQNDVVAITVYSTDGEILACSGDKGTLKKGNFTNLSFDKELFSEAQKYAISKPHVQTLFNDYYPWVVTIARLRSLPLYGGDVYVAMDVSFTSISDYIDVVGVGQHGYCYIIDNSGIVVYHPQQQIVFSGIKAEPLAEVVGLKDGVHYGKDIIYTVKSLPNCTWKIVGKSYTDDINQSRTRTVVRVIILSVLFCALVALLILLIFSKIITQPVRQLVSAMKDFESDAADYRYDRIKGNVAEIETLSDSFGHMVFMVQELMEKVRREEVTLRKTELRALQAQINPHFLYNTLDSIQWMCEQNRMEDAVKMVGALAKLFRISISRGNELITIADEMRHAESYLIIQSYRYKNRFTYKFSIDESICDCLCNKITVQPLIENAIYHGIENMVDEGEINVNVKADGNDVVIEVSDNGVGMTDEQCRSILCKEKSDSSGIGIKNVNDRLKIYFGEQYGISIKSELDVGTTVTVRLPQKRKDDME